MTFVQYRTRRALVYTLLLFSLSIILASCGESRVGSNLVAAARYSVSGLPNVAISREKVDKIPYATIAAKIGKGPRSILVFWRAEGSNLHWLSADNVAVVTQHGRIVRTAGLPSNLRSVVLAREDPLALGLHRAEVRQQTYHAQLDLDGSQRRTIAVSANYFIRAEEEIEIAGINFDTIRIDEVLRAKTINWAVTNTYWIDPADGFVWRSVQHAHPALPPFEIDVLKPAQL